MSLVPLVQVMQILLFSGAVSAAPKSATKTEAVKSAAPARVITAMSTPLRSGHPVLFLLSGEPGADPIETRLQFPADQRYSKWSVIFDSPLQIEQVEVETCAGTKPFSDGVELFVDLNEKRLFIDGGKKTAKFKLKSSVRALTLGFLESQGLCLGKISLQTTSEWLRPRTIAATGHRVIADGSLGISLRTIGEGEKTKFLGESRAERKPGEWMLTWQNPLIVESVRVWNGNQNPGENFNDVDRVKDIEIRTDGGKPMHATLEDRRHPQQLELGGAHPIRTLELKSVSSYPGNIVGEPNLAEVQLSAGGENWIPVVVASETNSGESLQATVIRDRGYGDVLDRELRADDRGQTWKFRIRSDGTFFARVFMDKARVAKAWSVTGAWNLLDRIVVPASAPSSIAKALSKSFAKTSVKAGPTAAAPVSGLGLSLVGVKIASAEALDSLPCGSNCFSGAVTRAPTDSREQPVSEQIELQREGRSIFLIRNRTDQEKRTLEFADLKVRVHSLFD